ncbi:MAG: hypothetical protein J6L93_04760, partial [Butyrivibrio sp.]|nr:hypothetical protein [Butyrivibrio sp.]
MRNKTVIGLNLEHFLKALIAIVIGFISLLLPFTSKEAGRKNMVSCAISVLGSNHSPAISFFLYLAVVLTVVSLLVGIASYIWTSVKIVRCWMYVQICATFFWTMLLFAAKIILDESGVESDFLIKNAGVGFFLGIISAYCSLVFIMKVAEVNV